MFIILREDQDGDLTPMMANQFAMRVFKYRKEARHYIDRIRINNSPFNLDDFYILNVSRSQRADR